MFDNIKEFEWEVLKTEVCSLIIWSKISRLSVNMFCKFISTLISTVFFSLFELINDWCHVKKVCYKNWKNSDQLIQCTSAQSNHSM